MSTTNPVEPFERHPLTDVKELRFSRLIDEIYRGEVAASEAYRQIESKFAQEFEKRSITSLAEDHEKAAMYWRGQCVEHHHHVQNSSGSWGKLVEIFVGVSKVFGKKSALHALKEGEIHGVQLYERMLASDALERSHIYLINKEFLPNQKRHISRLDSLIRFT